MESTAWMKYSIQTYDDSVWVNYFKSSYIYDGNNNKIEELLQDWDGSAWENSHNWLYTYDVT